MMEQNVVNTPKQKTPVRPTFFRLFIWRFTTMGIGRRRITTSKKIETAPRAYTELALGMQYPGISGFHDFWT
jgi:hypothetical protein